MTSQVVKRDNYEPLTPAQIEAAINRLEEERMTYDRQFREEKARAHAVLDRKNEEIRTARLTAQLPEDHKAALLGVPGIESTAELGSPGDE